ncbi:cell division protein [Halobacteriales archaeon QS_8_69_26]|nr:MAG: cell division protein [Halobacteriales archaeon QS_8_69_26]
MRVALIGVGQAGGKVTEALVEYDYNNEFDAVRSALAVNTAQADLQSLRIDTMLVGEERVKGHGVGADNELGAEIMETDANVVLEALQARVTAEVDALFVVAGLGGGTGSGGAPVLVRELKRVYDVPVYALGILPGRGEGSIYQVNAGRSLKTLIREADATLLVDNDAWHESGESVVEAFDEINKAIAQRVGLFLAAGENVEGVAESVVDSSEVINTLREGGIAALGYSSAVAAADASENVNTVMSATREALYTGTSLPDATEADAALLVIAGRPDAIPRKGVERARSWLEEELGSMQIRGGDFPLESDRIAAVVLLAGVEGSGRVQEFFDRAKEAKEQAENRRQQQDPEEAFQSEELDDLF